MSARKDMAQLIKSATKRGWKVMRERNHTVLLWPPTGERISVASTASDRKAIVLTKTRMRRAEQGRPVHTLTEGN